MLWRAIARYAMIRTQLPVLFGAVSISNQYNPASRQLMVRFFENQNTHPLSEFVKPRKPFRASFLRNWGLPPIEEFLGVECLSSCISGMEADGKGLPILLKHYLRVGGTVLSFSVDKKFSKVLDGLVMVDLKKIDPLGLQAILRKRE